MHKIIKHTHDSNSEVVSIDSKLVWDNKLWINLVKKKKIGLKIIINRYNVNNFLVILRRF